jgi:hypothetical protein
MKTTIALDESDMSRCHLFGGKERTTAELALLKGSDHVQHKVFLLKPGFSPVKKGRFLLLTVSTVCPNPNPLKRFPSSMVRTLVTGLKPGVNETAAQDDSGMTPRKVIPAHADFSCKA